MAARIEHMVRAERELLAGVSHERVCRWRIRVALELAEEGDPAGAQRRLGQIAEDLQELERLVEDVLGAARLDRTDGSPPLRRARVDAAEIARQAEQRFVRANEGRALRVELEEGASLDADPALLRRALDNLLDNARKYSDGPIVLRLAIGPSEVRYSVQDQGIGVTPEDLPRLGTPFFRTDQSRARGTGGVGLGLHLCRKIAQAHGGALALQSAPGVGTTASLTVPRVA
jgi:signal transduction histidine kinase